VEWDGLCVALVDSQGCGACAASCGNDAAERGERCDGSDLAGQTCESLGYSGGTLRCAGTCDAFDTGQCGGIGPVCPNNVKEGLEACDTNALGGLDCADFGFASGTLGCKPTCDAFDTAGCVSSGTTSCGNGFVNGVDFFCDADRWGSLGGPACNDFSLGTGTATCTAACIPDLSVCQTGDLCAGEVWYNDGFCQPCELLGGQPDDLDCRALCIGNGFCADRFLAGVWSCKSAGMLDPDCGTCGNGVREGNEYCDGADMGSLTCADFGYSGGTLGGCEPNCIPDFSACIMQGDCCVATLGVQGCSNAAIRDCVCQADAFCCTTEWDSRCVNEVGSLSCGTCP